MSIFSLISLPALAEDSTYFVRLNDNPFSPPFYVFSNEVDGDAVSVSLAKGSTYTFIRTDSGHPFNIGDAWKQANPDVVMTSNGTGGEVGGVASISSNEQLTLTIPENFTGSTLAYYCYTHSGMLASLPVVEPIVFDTWDLDANGQADALTDGLILLRYAFDLSGDALTKDAVAPDSPLTSMDIQNNLDQVESYADVDGDGQLDALSDGLLVLRFLFGLTGESLVKDAVSESAIRSTSLEIAQYITSYKPGMAGQTLDQSTALLVPMASGEEFTTQFTQSYISRYGGVAEMEDDAIPEGDSVMEASVDVSAGESFTTTYTLEEGVDEHDFVKYDGSHLFIAPSYSLYDDCCFIFEPMVMFDDAIQVGDDSAVAGDSTDADDPIRTLKILATDSTAASTEQVAQIVIENNKTIEGLYTTENQLVSIDTSGWWGMYGDVFMEPYTWQNQTIGLDVYDISEIPDNSVTDDLHEPELLWEFELEGGFVTSRKKGDIVYLIARHTPSIPGYDDYPPFEQAGGIQSALETVTSEDLLPQAYINDVPVDFLNSTDCLKINENHNAATDAVDYGYPTMTLLVAVNIAEQTIENSTCFLETTHGVYVSQEAVYFIQQEGWADNSKSFIHKFDLNAELAYTGSGEVQGHLTGRGQVDFRINEYDGYVRIVTSQWLNEDDDDPRDHLLTVLQQSSDSYNLEQVSVLPNSTNPDEIGKPNESLYGVRFFGDKLYLVTFELIDPLYVIDLSNHQEPEIIGELEVPGFSDFLHPVNENLLLGLGQIEGKVKLELFNVSPANEPYSIEEIVIGEGLANSWSHSPAQFNRNAFQYQQVDQSTDRFSVPVSISYSSPDQGYVNENQLHLFKIQNKDQADSATLDNVGFMSGQSRGWWNNDRQRSFFHGESIFYVNGETVFSSTWDEVATSTP